MVQQNNIASEQSIEEADLPNRRGYEVCNINKDKKNSLFLKVNGSSASRGNWQTTD
jgi:hypothetical protein